MKRLAAQAGFSLIEAAVTTALVAVAIGGALWAMQATGRFGAHQAGPHREAALSFTRQLIASAQNAWKYGQPGNSPAGSWTTTVPLSIPGSANASMPVTVTATFTQVQPPDPNGVDPTLPAATVTLNVTYPPDGGHQDPGTVSAQATLHVKAPAPGSRIFTQQTIPAPNGAP